MTPSRHGPLSTALGFAADLALAAFLAAGGAFAGAAGVEGAWAQAAVVKAAAKAMGARRRISKSGTGMVYFGNGADVGNPNFDRLRTRTQCFPIGARNIRCLHAL